MSIDDTGSVATHNVVTDDWDCDGQVTDESSTSFTISMDSSCANFDYYVTVNGGQLSVAIATDPTDIDYTMTKQ